MFGPTGTDVPYRSRKDLARAQQLRGFTRRRTGLSTNGMWMPMLGHDLRRGPDILGRDLSSFSRFEELDDAASPPFTSFNETPYGSPYAKDSERRAEYSRETLSFEKVADALFQTLHFASKQCRSIHEQFRGETESTSMPMWAAPRVIDGLWSMKLNWNGISHYELTTNPNSQPAPDAITYRGVAKRLSAALEDMKMSGRPRSEYIQESKLSPELLRMTLKKLHVIMQSIEELMQSVMKDRTLMDPLIKDMISATTLLLDMEGLWRPSVKASAGKGREQWVDDDNYVWPDYRGE